MTARILLIDDDDVLRRLLGLVLRRSGYEVEEALNGIEALAALERRDFDLLVVDVMMPLLDGARFLSLIRKERDIDTPALVLTSMDRDAVEDETRRAGVYEVVVKPIGPEAFLQRVRALLPA